MFTFNYLTNGLRSFLLLYAFLIIIFICRLYIFMVNISDHFLPYFPLTLLKQPDLSQVYFETTTSYLHLLYFPPRNQSKDPVWVMAVTCWPVSTSVLYQRWVPWFSTLTISAAVCKRYAGHLLSLKCSTLVPAGWLRRSPSTRCPSTTWPPCSGPPCSGPQSQRAPRDSTSCPPPTSGHMTSWHRYKAAEPNVGNSK